MKKYVLLLVMSITLITLYAQDKSIAINLNPLLKQPEALNSKEVRKISSSTAFLILDLNSTDSLKMTEDKLIEKYNLIKKDKTIYKLLIEEFADSDEFTVLEINHKKKTARQ